MLRAQLRRVADQHFFNVDPEPAFQLNADPDTAFHFSADADADPYPALIKVMRICDHWSTDPPGLHFEPLQLLKFDLNVYQDPASKNNADPCESGCATMQLRAFISSPKLG
jgi:hypothetical protein